MKKCSVDGCESSPSIKGLCPYHYNKQYREMRANNPDYKLKTGKPLKWIKDKVGYKGDDCIFWPFARTKAGYPNMAYKGSYIVASRLMCILAHGEPESKDMHAAHSCGRGMGGCMNPNHLSWKTAYDNEKDKLRHGTRHRGEDCSFSKLTWDVARGIRRDRETMRNVDVSRKYGVSPKTVSKIFLNQAWVEYDE